MFFDRIFLLMFKRKRDTLFGGESWLKPLRDLEHVIRYVSFSRDLKKVHLDGKISRALNFIWATNKCVNCALYFNKYSVWFMDAVNALHVLNIC